MTELGCDYSWSRPDPACLFSKSIRFAGRYTQPDDWSKSMSYGEARRLVEHGIWLFTIHQPSGDKGWMTNGSLDRGRRAAREALSIARDECGMDADRPIYYALDVDPRPLTAQQWDRVRLTLDGAAEITAPTKPGIYGGYLAMVKMLEQGPAGWGFQTKSWSVDPNTNLVRWHPRAQLQQYAHNLTLCGGQIDYVRATAADYGQWDP